MATSPTAPLSPSRGVHDEYTDYSCSTSIERLARDVESILRSWHVDKGNDRHISIKKNNANTGSAESLSSDGSRYTTQKQQQQQQSSVLLLRSEVLNWTVSLRTSFTVELQLCLWDGPTAMEVNHGKDKEEEYHSGLPHALQRTAQLSDMPPCLFENFSSLFGIGQHITLTPKAQPQQQYLSTLLEEELYPLAQSLSQRHDNDHTARWMLQQILSGWLQTALNCAVANCQCCLPIFGLWGPYQPKLSQCSKSGDLQVFPSWLQELAKVELPPPPRMSRKQFLELQALQNDRFLPPALTGMVLPTAHTSGNFWCSILPSVPSASRLTTWGSILLQHCPEDTVVLWCARHVFTWRKQPLQKATAFEMLFNPDNYHLERENNPYTEWRRRRLKQPNKDKPKIMIRNAEGIPQHVIDLTGEEHDDNEDSLLTYYRQYEKYKDECRQLALALLEQAAGASPSEPIWGPYDDPVASVHATVTWNGNTVPIPGEDGASSNIFESSNGAGESPSAKHTMRQPLLSFPLRIRSHHSMSQEDWTEMEESVERTILDPMGPCQFTIQIWWDLETPVASLAATQRCVLAALIRTATLPDETLLKHIADDAVVEQWDNDSGTVVAACLAHQANVGPSTKALVDAMDWDTVAKDKMELRDAETLVRHILRHDNGSDFPQPPTSPLNGSNAWESVSDRSLNPLAEATAAASPRRNGTNNTASVVNGSSSNGDANVDLYATEKAAQSSQNALDNGGGVNPFAPLFKSAPVGRLVSILCAHMARLRSPCSMAMLWLAFCHEVRIRWEHRVQLPHMNYIPGLDPSPTEIKRRNQGLTSLGLKAHHAAFWHGNEASKGGDTTGHSIADFPGDHHCLIGQKLLVVNFCIELAMIGAQQKQKKSDKRARLGELDGESSSVSTTNDAEEKSIAHREADISSLQALSPSFSVEGKEPLSEDDLITDEDVAIAAAAKRNMGISQQSNQVRRGARCPIPGCNLVATGDVLYAPFLQRPYPLTDDVIAERRKMLAHQQNGTQKRLEVLYRLQKPKLLSDMRAFKAANPSSIFQDFVNWYGNPGNPLDEYSGPTASENIDGTTNGDMLVGRASAESVAMKLDKASEAILMLNETREFWKNTWDEAIPKAASEQKPLFDVNSTVEMAVDFLETLHPAVLVGQIMSVSLAVAYFTLMGAAKETNVLKVGGLLQRYFDRLRKEIENALELLSSDATKSTSAYCNDARRQEGASSFVSLQTIAACDAACNALSDAEVMIARATSLLNKFPEQYELVESILRAEAGKEIVLSGREAQRQILQAIQKQQEKGQFPSKVPATPDTSPFFAAQPALREYVFRNLDDSHPCQLSVRFGVKAAPGKKANTAREQGKAESAEGLIVALTKTRSDEC
mgnify:CR=1 FL=1